MSETKKEPEAPAATPTVKNEEPWRAEWGAEHDRVKAIREKRQKEGLCVMCGKRLGFFDKYAGRLEHRECLRFKE